MGVRGFGQSLEEAFEQAALGLAAIVTDKPVKPKLAVTVVCEASDNELLLVEWLDAVIYEMAARHMLFGRFSVTIRGRRLYGTAWGETVGARYSPNCEPTAATLTELRVARNSAGLWSAGCVIDI
jgi:tRNA nucleotidyltransferase (CCA-adding enzyme)